MSTLIPGVVSNGVVVPGSPLPEGVRVQILLPQVRPEVSIDLQDEVDGRGRVTTNPVEMFEGMPEEKQAIDGIEQTRYPLRGSVLRYEHPTESVAEGDWEVLS